jgi:oxalate decarboxylase/phosphoglucose isomerase-like protein (cupin superfamily)
MSPGTQSPLHWHYVEEQLVVVVGTAEVHCDGETITVGPGQTVVFPARLVHGFKNVGDEELHVIGAWPWPFLEVYFDQDPPGVVTRQYEAWEEGGARKLGTSTS